MMYDDGKTCCPAPGLPENQPGLTVRLDALCATCREILLAVADLHSRTYGNEHTPNLKMDDKTISGLIDSGLEAARCSLSGLQTYLEML